MSRFPTNDGSDSKKHLAALLASVSHFKRDPETLLDFDVYTDVKLMTMMPREVLDDPRVLDYRHSVLCTLIDNDPSVEFVTKIIAEDYAPAFGDVKDAFRTVLQAKPPYLNELIDFAVTYHPVGISHALQSIADKVRRMTENGFVQAVFGKDIAKYDQLNWKLTWFHAVADEVLDALNATYNFIASTNDGKPPCGCPKCVAKAILPANFVKMMFFTMFPDSKEFDKLLLEAQDMVETAKKTGKLPSGLPYDREARKKLRESHPKHKD